MNVFRKKSVEQTLAETGESGHALKRDLTWWDLAIMGVAVAVGAGIFSIGAQAAAFHAGPAVVLSFLIAGVVCGAAVMCYAEFASMIPVAGSAYTFTYTTVGEIVAWVIGWDLILEMLMAGSVVSKYWGVYLNQFFELIGWNINTNIAIGSFKELNIIVKGDVDGSIEAMSGSLIKLSKETVQVNVIHSAVGQISESDVLLAAASNAIIVGFQVRPSASARRLAEKEEIEIRLYSIIYDAINEIEAAMKGMLAPKFQEQIIGHVEIRQTFKVSKVGTVCGGYVTDGKIQRSCEARIVRDGIVIHEGHLASLQRFKDAVKEVASGYECGLNFEKFNDIKEGDVVEAYVMEQIEQ